MKKSTEGLFQHLANARIPSLSDIRLLAAFPRTALRVAAGAARVMAGEERPLRGVEFCLTYRCRLDCEHCLTKPLIQEDRPEMDCAQAVGAIRDLVDFGVIFVNLTGGEPLLRRDIFDILDASTRKRDALITLASNGEAIDLSVAAELKRTRVAIVTLSLDGPDAETHDASRGRPGAFDRLMEAVDALRRVRVPVWFTTILTRRNACDGSIFRTAELAKRLKATLTVNWSYAIGKKWSKRGALVSRDELRAFDALMKMPQVRWEGSTNFRAEGCPAGSEKIYVTPYGDVFPCAIIQAGFGNMLTTPIADIWRRMGRVSEFDGHVKPCLVACDEGFIRTHFHTIRQNPGAVHEGWCKG